MIVQAFAAGDRSTLRALLSDDAFSGFARVLDAREAAGETQRTELRSVNEVAIERLSRRRRAVRRVRRSRRALVSSSRTSSNGSTRTCESDPMARRTPASR